MVIAYFKFSIALHLVYYHEFGDSRHHAINGHQEVIFSNQKSSSDNLEVCLSSPGNRSQYLERCLLDQLPVVNRYCIKQQDGNNVAIPSENAVPPHSAPIPRSHNDNFPYKPKIALSYTTNHLIFHISSLFTSNAPINPQTNSKKIKSSLLLPRLHRSRFGSFLPITPYHNHTQKATDDG